MEPCTAKNILFSDNFNRANSTTIDSGWNETGSDALIQDNALQIGNVINTGVLSNLSIIGDHTIEFLYIDNDTSRVDSFYINFWMQTNWVASNGYKVSLNDSSTTAQLKYSNGTNIDTAMTGGLASYPVNGTKVTLTINQSGVYVFYNDTYRGKGDWLTGLPEFTSGYGGLSRGTTSTQTNFDDFKVFNYSNDKSWYEEAWGMTNGSTYELGRTFDYNYITNATINVYGKYQDPDTFFQSLNPKPWFRLDGNGVDSSGTYTTTVSNVNWVDGMFNGSAHFMKGNVNISEICIDCELDRQNKTIILSFLPNTTSVYDETLWAKRGSYDVTLVNGTRIRLQQSGGTSNSSRCVYDCVVSNKTNVLVITFAGADLTNETHMYINGVEHELSRKYVWLSNSTNSSGCPCNGRLGNRANDRYFNGSIDNFMIVPGILNATQIAEVTYWLNNGAMNFTVGGTTAKWTSNPLVISTFSNDISSVVATNDNATYGETFINNSPIKYNITLWGSRITPRLTFTARKGISNPSDGRMQGFETDGHDYYSSGIVEEWMRQTQLLDSGVYYQTGTLEQMIGEGNWSNVTGWSGLFNQTSLNNFNRSLGFAAKYNIPIIMNLADYAGLHYDAVNASYTNGGEGNLKWQSYMWAYKNFTAMYASNTTIIAWIWPEWYYIIGKGYDNLGNYNETYGTYSATNLYGANVSADEHWNLTARQNFTKQMIQNISEVDWNHSLIIEVGGTSEKLHYHKDVQEHFKYGLIAISEYENSFEDYADVANDSLLSYLKTKSGKLAITQFGTTVTNINKQYNNTEILKTYLAQAGTANRGYDAAFVWSMEGVLHNTRRDSTGYEPGDKPKELPFYWHTTTWVWDTYYANLTAKPFRFINTSALSDFNYAEQWYTSTPEEISGLRNFKIIKDGVDNATSITTFWSTRSILNGTRTNNTVYTNGSAWISVTGNGSLGELGRSSLSIIPNSDSVNVTIYTFNTSGDFRKIINLSSSNAANTANINLSGFPILRQISVYRDGTLYTTTPSNATGWINYNYAGGFSDHQFDFRVASNNATISFRATFMGAAGNNIATSTTISNGVWGAAFLSGGVSGNMWSSSDNTAITNGSELWTQTTPMFGATTIVISIGVVFLILFGLMGKGGKTL